MSDESSNTEAANDAGGFEPAGALASWDARNANLRDWSDENLLDGLAQLGIKTDKEAFTKAAKAAPKQASLEDDWLESIVKVDQNIASFVWMTVQELWERWLVDAWPEDRLGRMFAYLVDADFSTEWADRFHAPTGLQVMAALEAATGELEDPRAFVDGMVEQLGMPAAAWPGQMLDAMAQWSEVGNIKLAERGGAWVAQVLGTGHAYAYLAASYMSARMYDRATAAAMQVPNDAKLERGFDEMVGYLCLAAGDAMSAHYWLAGDGKRSRPKRSELTFAAETARDFVKGYKDNGGAEVTERIRKASMQAASQACYFAFMAFAGADEPA